MIFRQNRRGVSTVVGAVFFVILMVGIFSALFAAFQLQENLIDTNLESSDLMLKKVQEDFSIRVCIDDFNNRLYVDTTNNGPGFLQIADLLIVNQTDTNFPATRYEINYKDTYLAQGSTDNVIKNQQLIMDAGSYDVKLVSNKGFIKKSSLLVVPTVDPGAFKDVFASGSGLLKPQGLNFAPDGDLHVASKDTDNVLRYDAATGDFDIDIFSGFDNPDLDKPASIAKGSDGNFYVSGEGQHKVRKYNSTGGIISDFVKATSGGLNTPSDILFHSDGKLYVSSTGTDQVLRYNNSTGAFIDVFVTTQSGGLDGPRGIIFDTDGDLHVASERTDQILRYHGTNGTFRDVFVIAQSGKLDSPRGIVFGPDKNLYVASKDTSNVLRFKGITSAAEKSDSLDLGTLDSYGILGAGITGTNPRTIDRGGDLGGDIGASSLTPLPTTVSGTTNVGNTAYTQAIADLITARTEGHNRDPTTSVTTAKEISGTINPGVHYNLGAVSMSTTLTFDGSGIYIMQYKGAFTAAANSKMTLTNDAKAKDIFWIVEGAATIGAGSHFIGSVLSKGALTVGPGVTVDGRLLTLAAMTWGSSDITVPSQAPGEFINTFLSVFASGDGLGKTKDIVFGPDNHLYVSSETTDSVFRFNGTSGVFIDKFITTQKGGLVGPRGLLFDSGNLYVASEGTDEVKKYDDEGAFETTFVTEGLSLGTPQGIAFNSAGDLFVSGEVSNNVFKYTGGPASLSPGAFVNVFVSASAGSMNKPSFIVFGPDDNLYLPSKDTHQVLRYNGTSGAYMDIFVSAASGGLNTTRGIAFGPDDNLYAASEATNKILKYNGSTGAFISVFATGDGLLKPQGIAFGPDDSLFVASKDTNSILRYNGTSGNFIDEFVSAGSGGLSVPKDITFGHNGRLYVASEATNNVLRYQGPGDGSGGSLADFQCKWEPIN